MELTISELIPVAAFISYGALLSVAIWRAPRTGSNHLFSLYLICALIWGIGSFMVGADIPFRTRLLWSKLMGIGLLAMPLVFFQFVRAFLGIKEQQKLLYGGLISYIIILIANLMGYVTRAAYVSGDVFRYRFGVAMPGAAFMWYTFLGLAMYNLVRQYPEVKDKFYRKKLSYLLVAAGLMGLAGFISFAFPRKHSLDILLNAVNALIIGQVIFGSKFVDFKLVIRKGFVYLALTFFVMAIYLFTIFTLEKALQGMVGYTIFLISIAIGIIIIVFTFKPLGDLAQFLIDKLFFRERFDYYPILREFVQKISTILNFDELANSTVKMIGETMRTKKVSLLMREGKEFRVRASMELNKNVLSRIKLKKDNPLTARMIKEGKILTRNGLEKDEAKQLQMLNAELLVPLISKNDLVGVLILGERLLNKTYSKEDCALLSTVANQVAIALENARLYTKIEQSLVERTKLHEISLSLSRTFDISTLLQLIADNALSITNSQRSVIVLLDKDKQKIHQTVTQASIEKFSYKPESPEFNDITWRTIREKKSFLIKATDSSSSMFPLDDLKAGIRTIISLPLVGRHGILGALVVSNTSLTAFEKEEMEVLSILAEQASISMERAQLIKDLSQAKIELEQGIEKKAEQLRRSQTQLLQSEKLAGIGQLAAGITHEIRNPLGIISMSIYYLKDVLSKEGRDIKRHLEIIDSEINRCQKIINNLLDFSRKSTAEIEIFDVNALLNITLSLVEKDLLVRDIKLTRKMEDIPRIVANVDEMKQVFLNLILNATQAMPTGGKLKVKTSAGDKKVKIEISDSGVGIPRKNLDNIFNPFFTTKEPGKGVGLGLSITHSIIEKHGGTIEVESEEGKGTTFVIELPTGGSNA